MAIVSTADLDVRIFETCYPIGSIFITERAENPNVILTGGVNSTWEKIQGRFIRATDDTIVAGSTGGSNSTILTVANLPAHNHYRIDK